MQRSVRRWLWTALDDTDWTLRDERFEVPDDDRPAGYIEAATPVSAPFARTGVPQGDVQKRVTITASLYPVTSGTAEECGQRARELVDLMEQSMMFGLILPGEAGPPVVEELPLAPGMLPLWDFTDVGPEEEPGRVPVAFADVDSITARDVPDPLDDRRWTVIFELRLSWWAGGRSRWGSEEPGLVDRVEGEYVP